MPHTDFATPRQGTLEYFAIRRMSFCDGSPVVPQALRHDLESFYWALLRVVLLCTNHTLLSNMKSGPYPRGWDMIFESPKAKLAWLREQAPTFGVLGNVPLTHLLRAFAVLVLDNATHEEEEYALDYAGVLALFEEVLGWDSWPAEDNDGPYEEPRSAQDAVIKEAEREGREIEVGAVEKKDGEAIGMGGAVQRKCRCAESQQRRAKRNKAIQVPVTTAGAA